MPHAPRLQEIKTPALMRVKSSALVTCTRPIRSSYQHVKISRDLWPIYYIILPAMPGIYRPRHPERTVLYRVLFHYFDRFLTECESRFEKEFDFFPPDRQRRWSSATWICGNPRCGFDRIRCPDCQAERLLMFSCHTRRFCPSCHAKRLEEWGEWMRKVLRPMPSKG